MRGFTLVELIVVVGTAVLLVVISAGTYTTFLRRSDVDTETRRLQSVLNLARSKTLASEEDRSYGVHMSISTNEYFLFPGTVYQSGNTENERYVVARGVEIRTLNFNDAGMDVVFNRLSGAPSQYGSITLEDASNAFRSRVICIHETGAIEIQAACAQVSLEYTGGTIDGNLASFPSSVQWGDPAQSFTMSATSAYAQRVEVYVRRTTANPSNVFLDIRSGSTVGPLLGRSRIVPGVTLAQGYAWVSFVFPRPVYLLANTQYFLRLRSLADSTVSNATGTIYWGYNNASSGVAAYNGGDAWIYVGRNDIPSDQGELAGASNPHDFSFRVIYGIDPPPSTDSRHMEFELEDANDRGWSIQGRTTLTLTFKDPPAADMVENVVMAPYFTNNNTEFEWSGDVNVNGNIETVRIHTLYLDGNDTILSIHRDRRLNQKAVDISIDGRAVVSYAANGTPTVGAWGGNMVYR